MTPLLDRTCRRTGPPLRVVASRARTWFGPHEVWRSTTGICSAAAPRRGNDHGYGGMTAELDGDRGGAETDVAALIPLVRRVVGTRVSDAAVADDLVQETLV